MVLRAKITILGEPEVGKTSLILKFVKNKFPTGYKPTLGADFLLKNITSKEIPELGDKVVELIIWDIGGQSSYEMDKMTDYYLQGSNAFIMIYDKTNKVSLKELDKWYKKIIKVCGKIPFLVVGNKMDLTNIEIDESTLKPYKRKWKTKFVETSAKTGESVSDIFVEITRLLI